MKRTNQKGITLIALIVTIIVLIIIAGISIATLTADNGILRQTNAAKVSQIEGNAREQVKLACSAVRLAVAEAQAKDNSYSAKANSSAIQKTLIDVLQADKKDLTGDFSNGGTPAGNDLDEIKIVYVGDDYTQATNNPDAKITYTIGLSQKTVELKDEENVTLKDQHGNDVELDIGNNEGTGSVELPDNAAGLYEAGSDYTVQLKTWQELLDEGIVHVENGVVYTGYDEDNFVNSSASALAGDLVLPNDGTITSIGESAFDECTSLTSVIIPDSVTNIDDFAFYYCTSLTSITIPDSVTSIGESAFEGCINLTSITIPDSVTSIGESAFDFCENLIRIVVDSGNMVYHSDGNCLIETANKKLIAGCNNSVIPTDGSVTSIGDWAFSGCSNLINITIPDSVTSIGESAFFNCENLKTINFGVNSQLTSIGKYAFYYCENLNTINFEGTIAQWNAITFGYGWNIKVPATKVQCSDGTVSLS